METIDMKIYEPVPGKKGLVREIGFRKAKDVFHELEERLRQLGLYPDEYFVLNSPYDDKDATAEQIQTAYENLQTAIEGLKKEEPVDPEPTPDPVNKDALWALLEKYDGYVSTDYTADSWAAFYASYQAACAVATNEEATQDEVDAAVAALERTGAALVPASPAEEEPGTTPETNPDNEYNQTEKPADTSASMPIAPFAIRTAKSSLSALSEPGNSFSRAYAASSCSPKV